MASISNQILINTETGEKGEKGEKRTSWNQRQDEFVIFTRLKGKPKKPVKVWFYTSPNNRDWVQVHEALLSEDGQLDCEPPSKPMLVNFKVVYDVDALNGKVTKKNIHDKQAVDAAQLFVQVCYRDKK